MEKDKYLKVADFREQLMIFIFLANEWIADQCNKCPDSNVLSAFRCSNQYREANLYISLLTENIFDRNLIEYANLPNDSERMKLLNNILIRNNITTGFLYIIEQEYINHLYRCDMLSKEQRDKKLKIKNILDNTIRSM